MLTAKNFIWIHGEKTPKIVGVLLVFNNHTFTLASCANGRVDLTRIYAFFVEFYLRKGQVC